MNCPICIATIRGMGFDFNPPLAYFDKLFARIAQIQPNPVLLFFGGEPTVREDLLDLVALARKHGLRPHVVTNGIRLADEDYCQELCRHRIPFRFAFDGRNADIYEKLRRNRGAYDKKMAGLANLSRFSLRKHTLIATAGKGFNDAHMADLFEYIHANRDLISDIGLIPLTENWEPGSFESGVQTTMEDVEKMVAGAIPGGQVEFIPAGLSYALRQVRSFFRPDQPRSEVLLLAGAHPNCESMTLLISDGRRYRGINHYLHRPMRQVAVEFAAKARRLEARLNKLNPRKFLSRQWGRLLIIASLLPWFVRRVRVVRLMGYPFVSLWNRLTGQARRAKLPAKASRRPRRILRVAMLPFEEEHSIDAARLENCKGVFAYEKADTGEVDFIPACLWYPYRNGFLEQISRKYGVVRYNANRSAT